MNKILHFRAVGCVLAATTLPWSAHAATVANGSSFETSAEILNLDELSPLLPVSVSVTNSGTVNYPDSSADELDSSLAFADIDLAVGSLVVGNVTLGVLGVNWLSSDTFELVFDLNPSITVGSLLSLDLSAGFDGTVDWAITGLDLDSAIASVTQIAGPDTGAVIGFTDDSITIASDVLLGLDLSSTRQTYQITTVNDVTAPVPLPAPALLMLGGIGAIGGLGALRRRRRPA